jgi:hypothetical protein
LEKYEIEENEKELKKRAKYVKKGSLDINLDIGGTIM